MTKTAKIILGLSIAFVALSVLSVVLIKRGNNGGGVGIPAGPEIENYVPSIMYNDGYFSRKGIYTTSTFQADDATTLSSTLAVTGATTLTGTTTITQSVDGLVVGGTFSTAATGTVRTVYTNSTGPKFCDSHTAFLYVKNNGFAPSLVFSLGTSTTAIASTNLVASSTVATTTTTVIVPTASSFILAAGDVLTAIIGDITNTSASSTYYGNWSAEAGVWCQDISI